VHTEAAGGFGNIEACIYQHFVDTLPLKIFDRGGADGNNRIAVAFGFLECGDNTNGLMN